MIRQRTSISLLSYEDLPEHEEHAPSRFCIDSPLKSSGCPIFQRVIISESNCKTKETQKCCDLIQNAVVLRERWLFHPKFYHPEASVDEIRNFIQTEDTLRPTQHTFKLYKGVYHLFLNDSEPFQVGTSSDFFRDLSEIMQLISNGPSKTFAYNRLRILEARFNLHILLNESNEFEQVKAVPHRDFYNIRKIDNHVHHSACMNQKHLLRFIKHKLKTEPDTIVAVVDGKEMSLKETFDSIKVTAYDLSIDCLDMHAHQQTFHRFDKFNQKYSPVGSSILRSVFLKTDNYIKGRFLAEITKEVFADLKSQKYQHAEYRLSIYGKNMNEQRKLAAQVVDNDLKSDNVIQMIQIPRLYEIYRANSLINSFEDMIRYIFEPLFEVTINPSADPKLFLFLRQVCGFDSVDDESVPEVIDYTKTPDEQTHFDNPPYAVQAYYIYANLYILNKLRESRGLNTFAFRPHSGEAGSIEHLAATFLLSQSINHGILLKKSPILQYLYYICQIGLSISPLSNNLLFVQHDKNPFPMFFACGMNVALSTDDPLMIHYTKDPLIEEYSIAAQVQKLSSIDMSEIARNSALQSGFDHRIKEHQLGEDYNRRGLIGNNIHQTNLPDIRVTFRTELLNDELRFLTGKGLPPTTSSNKVSDQPSKQAISFHYQHSSLIESKPVSSEPQKHSNKSVKFSEHISTSYEYNEADNDIKKLDDSVKKESEIFKESLEIEKGEDREKDRENLHTVTVTT